MNKNLSAERVGVDLGGTKTEIILTAKDPRQVIFKKRVSTETELGYAAIIQKLVHLIQEVQSQTTNKNLSIGISLPGSVSPKTGLIRNANTQCLNQQPLQQDLEQSLHQKVYLSNDANCLTISETLYGAGQGHKMVFGVIMGTGVGGGICYNQKLLQGLHGNAGEWGHSVLDIHGKPCWCGQRGCIEKYISGPAIQEYYLKLTQQSLNVQEIHTLYLQQQPAAVECIERFLKYFGIAMANLWLTLEPDVIVLGGGLSNLDLLYKQGVDSVAKYLYAPDVRPNIVKNHFGDSSGIYGAALLPDLGMNT